MYTLLHGSGNKGSMIIIIVGFFVVVVVVGGGGFFWPIVVRLEACIC